MHVITHPPGSGSSPRELSAILCLPCLFLFTASANAYSPSTFALSVWFDWHFARRRMVNQVAGWPSEGNSLSRRFLLRVVRAELSGSHVAANMGETRREEGQCYQLQHTALSLVALSICRQCHRLLH